MTSQISSPTVLISWAHRNTDWTPGQVKAWETTVKSFAERLRANRVNAQLDLYYQSDSSVDWTRWGQQMVRESDSVIIAASTAWKQRWEGTNAPTEGAGAVVEADALKGLFNTNQAEFQRKTLIVLLPGGSGDELPADLHRLNRFPVEEVTDTGIEDVLRTLYQRPRHAIPDLGPMPDLPPDTTGRTPLYDGDSASIQKCSPTASPTGDSSAPFVSAGSSVATRDVVNVVGNGNTVTVGSPNTYLASTTPYEIVARVEYLDRLHSASRSRREHRRLGAGLTPEQVSRSLSLLVHVPQDLKNLPAGEVRVLVGPLGSGKSDIAEEWIRSSITKAETDSDRTAPIPVWVSIGDLDGPLGNYIANEIGLPALSQLGVDIVVDGLDEHTDKAATALRQAAEFVAKWPNSRVVLTSRSQEKISSHLVVPAPSLSKAHAARMMARVAGHEIGSLGTHLETAVERPFFALLVARHATAAEGATGIPELIDLVVEAAVTSEEHHLYQGLGRVAVVGIRRGRAIDRTRFAAADVATQIRQSSLVTTTGRTCAFSLAIFEQWFAAKALLEGDVQVDDLLTSLRAFDRWKYVFAMVLAVGEPGRVDPVMARIAEWNPGAASWVIRETRHGGLSRIRPDLGPDDWEESGDRLRIATAAWLKGLGPLAPAFFPFAATGASDFDAVTVAVDIDQTMLNVAWLMSEEVPDDPLPPVISAQGMSWDRMMAFREHPIPTGVNWVWETSRDHLAGDLSDHFTVFAQHLAGQDSGVVQAEAKEAALLRFAPFPWFHDAESKTDAVAPLYPQADIPPSHSLTWGAFNSETMLERVRQIVSAAMTCYLELSNAATPRFGDTLGHRGLMPVDFYGNVSYRPTRERSAFEFPGPMEPRIQWLLKPTGSPAPDGRRPGTNSVSLTLNDETRAEEIKNDRNALYGSFRAYVEAYPAYAPFARSFSTHSGRFDLLQDKPATKLALSWLWKDLKDLGWVTGHFPRNL